MTFRVAVDGRTVFEAGPMSDSDPAREYQETINKATALLKAVEQSGDFL